MATTDRKHGALAHYVPALGWLPRYERRWLRLELIGSDHIHGNVNRAIEAQLAEGETADTRRLGDAAGTAR